MEVAAFDVYWSIVFQREFGVCWIGEEGVRGGGRLGRGGWVGWVDLGGGRLGERGWEKTK